MKKIATIVLVAILVLTVWCIAANAHNTEQHKHVTPTCAVCGKQTDEVTTLIVDGKPTTVCLTDAGELVPQSRD